MFDPLPPETFALKTILADLQEDLEGRVARLRLLVAIESDFGAGRGLFLPGGFPASLAYVETRRAYVNGEFLSVVLLSQCVLENALAAHLGLEAMSAEIHGIDGPATKPRPGFRDTINTCKDIGVLSEADKKDLFRLADLRNALAHFRTVDDPLHLDRRSISERRSAIDICEDDARFAVTLFVRILSKPAFRFKPNSELGVPTK